MPLDCPPQGPVLAKAAGLVYVHDDDPGIRREGQGRYFDYFGPDGKPVKDEAVLERIRKLVIPPAWTHVWICPDASGHIQATGRDARGRKQYRYHDEWRAHCDELKFSNMAAFGRALPTLRARVEKDLSMHGLPREKVLAAVVRLLELTLIRVGNDEYANKNKSFGLTTLRDRHVKFQGSSAVFEFRGKSGVVHRTGIRDRRLARIVRACQEVPGQRLFQYRDKDGGRHSISSHDVNAYIREATGGSFTAKDFRTWAGTLSCACSLLEAGPAASAAEAKRVMAACVKQTASRLGNTPAVCRSSYVHPGVFDTYAEGRLADRLSARVKDPERAMLRFLDELAHAA